MRRASNPQARKRPAPTRSKVSGEKTMGVVFTAEQIRRRVQKLAEELNRTYAGKTLQVVGILEDCFMFMTDLVRALKMPVYCQFVKEEIRDSSAGSVPVREIMFTPKIDASGRDILLLEGVLESGLTLDHLYHHILGQNPKSLRVAALIEKTDERKVDVPTDYVCFKTTKKYLVGYGLGYENLYRNLPYIGQAA
jgi:hypoxanthine phosphoribosyltransferase